MVEQKKRKYCEGYHFVSTLDKLPKTAHYAVLVQSFRTYPDSYSDNGGTTTDSIIEYIGFDDKEALDDYILGSGKDKTFRVIYVQPVELTLHTTVQIRAT